MISFAYPWALVALALIPLLYLYEAFVKKRGKDLSLCSR